MFEITGLIERYVDDLITVSEAEIRAGLRYLAAERGYIAEGPGAAAVAAVLAGKVSPRRHRVWPEHHPVGSGRCSFVAVGSRYYFSIGVAMTDDFSFDDDDDLPHVPKPGVIGKLIGKVIGRALALDSPEIMKAGLATLPGMAEVMRQVADDPSRYVAEPGQEPAPAEVIPDPGFAERLHRLGDHPLEGLPGGLLPIPRSAAHTFFFDATLEEDGDMIIVCEYGERIGRLNPAGTGEYAPHLRSARIHDQIVGVMVSGRMKRGRPSHVTVRLGGFFS